MSSMAVERPSGRRPDGAAGRDDVAVRLDRVTRRFGDVTALEAASLDIRRGELMTLLGPSGCGKTTMLNLIAGFLSADDGAIEIDGGRVNDVPTFRREIGMMFQSYALFPHMTVAGNVGYGLKMRRLPRSEIDRRVADVLALVKLGGLETRRPRQLSGGQQQRVALARALAIRPKVLLLDEPFSALDRNLRAAMQVEIKEIQRKLGVTTIFVTHDQGEALSLSDRIAVMADGRIRQVGTPSDVYRRPRDRFVASFVGDVTVLAARLESLDHGIATVALGAMRIAAPVAPLEGMMPGAPVDLFVRPEQLHVAEPGEPTVAEGVVAAQIYQGGHVDLHVGVADQPSGRVLVRLTGHDAMTRWPVGTRVGIATAGSDAVAFPRGIA
jgi:putative spermidine/putrescine transport system ATP-binding protein